MLISFFVFFPAVVELSGDTKLQKKHRNRWGNLKGKRLNLKFKREKDERVTQVGVI